MKKWYKEKKFTVSKHMGLKSSLHLNGLSGCWWCVAWDTYACVSKFQNSIQSFQNLLKINRNCSDWGHIECPKFNNHIYNQSSNQLKLSEEVRKRNWELQRNLPELQCCRKLVMMINTSVHQFCTSCESGHAEPGSCMLKLTIRLFLCYVVLNNGAPPIVPAFCLFIEQKTGRRHRWEKISWPSMLWKIFFCQTVSQFRWKKNLLINPGVTTFKFCLVS